MDFASIRIIIITGDVARLADCCDKAAAAHEGRKH